MKFLLDFACISLLCMISVSLLQEIRTPDCDNCCNPKPNPLKLDKCCRDKRRKIQGFCREQGYKARCQFNSLPGVYVISPECDSSCPNGVKDCCKKLVVKSDKPYNNGKCERIDSKIAYCQ